jgi:hypothetical protein
VNHATQHHHAVLMPRCDDQSLTIDPPIIQRVLNIPTS